MSDRLNFWNKKPNQPVTAPAPIAAPPAPPAKETGAPPREEPVAAPRKKAASAPSTERQPLRRRLGLKPTQVRTIYVSIALSEEERDYLRAYCDKHGIAFSGWLREVALNASRRPPVASAPSRRRSAKVRKPAG
jgi:hypothetical protein